MAVGRVQVQSPLWAASFFFFFLNSSLTGPWARDANTISPKDTGSLFCPQFSHRLIVCFSFDTWVLDRVENLCMPKEDHCWSLMFCKSSYSLVVSLKRGKIFFSPNHDTLSSLCSFELKNLHFRSLCLCMRIQCSDRVDSLALTLNPDKLVLASGIWRAHCSESVGIK